VARHDLILINLEDGMADGDDNFDPDSSESSSARETVLDELKTDSELDAFAIDVYGDDAREFSSSMARSDKVNLLLRAHGASEVLERLRDYVDHEVQTSEPKDPPQEFPVSDDDRDRIVKAFATDSELMAFVIDHFGDVAREYSDSMARDQKVELLLKRCGSDAVLAKLHEVLGDPLPDHSKDDQATAAWTVDELVEVLINNVFKTDSYQEAFLIDWFPDVQRQLSNGMSRPRKLEILFQRHSVDEVLAALASAGETLNHKDPPSALTPELPDAEHLRDALDQRFPDDTALNIFVMSAFRDVYDNWSDGMSRSDKIDALVAKKTADDVIAALAR